MARINLDQATIDVFCDDAYEFLELLSPINGLFASNDYIFRGVSSRAHQLLPSAHRDGAVLYQSPYETVKVPLGSILAQCAAEFHTIDKFFAIASRHGVRIPEDSFSVRMHLDSWRSAFDRNDYGGPQDRSWPSSELLSLIALAQHYDIPTRALDWTWSPYVAAYFASLPALTGSLDGYVVVWAFDDFLRKLDQLLETSIARPLLVYTVSGADNNNLRAQRGLFMIHPQYLGGPPDTQFTPRPYDQLLLEGLSAVRQSATIIRIAVLQCYAGQVLALLAGAGITRGALFPGLSGVAQEYRDEQIIQPGTFRSIHTSKVAELWHAINELTNRQGA